MVRKDAPGASDSGELPKGETVTLVFIPTFLRRLHGAVAIAYDRYSAEIRRTEYGTDTDAHRAEVAQDPRLNTVLKDKLLQRCAVNVFDGVGEQKEVKRGFVSGNMDARAYVEIPLDLPRDILVTALTEIFGCPLDKEDLIAIDALHKMSDSYGDFPMRAFEIPLQRLLVEKMTRS